MTSVGQLSWLPAAVIWLQLLSLSAAATISENQRLLEEINGVQQTSDSDSKIQRSLNQQLYNLNDARLHTPFNGALSSHHNVGRERLLQSGFHPEQPNLPHHHETSPGHNAFPATSYQNSFYDGYLNGKHRIYDATSHSQFGKEPANVNIHVEAEITTSATPVNSHRSEYSRGRVAYHPTYQPAEQHGIAHTSALYPSHNRAHPKALRTDHRSLQASPLLHHVANVFDHPPFDSHQKPLQHRPGLPQSHAGPSVPAVRFPYPPVPTRNHLYGRPDTAPRRGKTLQEHSFDPYSNINLINYLYQENKKTSTLPRHPKSLYGHYALSHQADPLRHLQERPRIQYLEYISSPPVDKIPHPHRLRYIAPGQHRGDHLGHLKRSSSPRSFRRRLDAEQHPVLESVDSHQVNAGSGQS